MKRLTVSQRHSVTKMLSHLMPSCCVSVCRRIYCENKHSFLQDCEDDGETAAGGRLLHLLQVIISLSQILTSTQQMTLGAAY